MYRLRMHRKGNTDKMGGETRTEKGKHADIGVRGKGKHANG